MDSNDNLAKGKICTLLRKHNFRDIVKSYTKQPRQNTFYAGVKQIDGIFDTLDVD